MPFFVGLLPSCVRIDDCTLKYFRAVPDTTNTQTISLNPSDFPFKNLEKNNVIYSKLQPTYGSYKEGFSP